LLVRSLAWLVLLATLGGCSILLTPEDRCSTDADCPGAGLVCRNGLCVTAEDMSDSGTPSESNDPYLLAYFSTGQSLLNNSLYFAYSTDGLHWVPLNDNQPVFTLSGVGTNRLRDPFLLRREDGTFVLLATDWTLAEQGPDYWNRPSSHLIVADSVDLTSFTGVRRVRVTNLHGPGGTDMHAWAPEAFFDQERNQYAIVWSGNDEQNINRIYASYTEDFTDIWNSTPAVYFDPGYSVIDGTVVRSGGVNYLFFKDESDGDGGPSTGSGKDIQVARTASPSLAPGGFVRWDADYITRGSMQDVRRATEGPLVFKVPNQDVWYLCADYFVDGGYGCWTTTDLDADPSTWRALDSSEYEFPTGAAHGSIVRVTNDELGVLIDHYESSGTPQVNIRTTYQEASTSFYVAHSFYHVMATHLDDRANGQLAGDFVWRVVPGLADPSDPDLVSLEPTLYPGRYLRIDSQNPDRYVPCPEASNRGYEACNDVPVDDRNHLAWIDPAGTTDTYRSDATFRRVPALNGDATMVSFQWLSDPTRYLRILNLQILAHVPDGTAAEQNDASFALDEI
jgi:hypothetical protein